MAHEQAFHRRTTLSSGNPSSPPGAVSYSVSPPAQYNNAGGSFSAMMAANASPSANAHALQNIASSPPSSYNGAISIPGGHHRTTSVPATQMPKPLAPFDNSSIRILLLEAVSQGAVETLKKQGYQVDYFKDAWSEEQLCEKLKDYHVVGIRSKTKLTEKVFKAAEKVREEKSPGLYRI